MINLGNLKRGEYFLYDGLIYKILGLGSRSYNNVQCMSIYGRKWFDVDTEVEEINIIDNNKKNILTNKK